MRVSILLLLMLCWGAITSAQNFDPRIAKSKLPLSDVELVMMPNQNNAALLEAELERRGPGVAPRFAEVIDVQITPETHGHWEVLDNGNALWRLRIRSNDAHSLNLGFTRYIMPTGGSLILYSPDSKHVMGPFTPADNEEHEQLWTPIFNGEELVIEVQLPAEERQNLDLLLKTVNHDFIGFTEMSSVLSGSCNLDVICSEADGWGIVDGYRDIIQSVAVIGLGGGTFCTGFLINNARNDCTPYFMTADHCGINNGNAASLVAYWNFENSTCRQPDSPASGGNGDGLLNDFNTGSIFRAGYAPSDMTLVELDDPVSETANAFFAGWSIEDTTPQDTVICVHHPSTDEKRISFEFDPTYRGSWGSGSTPVPDGNHVIVPDWDIGTTEGGSSGSPLFNKDKQVIGQLHGGGAACGNNSYDSYGWFTTSWEGGGTPQTRLKDWLDPDDTGIITLDGRYAMACSFSVEANENTQTICAPEDAVFQLDVSENFTGPVTITLEALPNGATATFSTNPVLPGGSTTLTISDTDALAGGAYTVIVSGTDGTETGSSSLFINISEAIPGIATLEIPVDMEEGTSTAPTLGWMPLGDNAVYEIEIANDAAFTDIVNTASGVEGNTYQSPVLESMSTYYWRVRASNICGVGEWTSGFSFTTAAISCAPRTSEDVPVAITTTGTPTITSTIEIEGTGSISDLRVVDLDIAHTYVGDLYVTLTSPSMTTVVLFDRPGVPATGFGCSGDNVLVNLDDLAANTADDLENSCGDSPAITGTFQPLEALAEFAGEPLNGVWTLTIIDNADQDGGQLNGWGLDICSTIPDDASLNPSVTEYEICATESVSFDITIGTGFGETGVTLSATGNPAGSTVTFSENPSTAGSTVTVTIENIAMAGDFLLSISGTDGSLTASTDIDIAVSGAPAANSLIAPANGANDIPLGPMLSWQASPEADNYQLLIATDMSFTNIVVDETTMSTNFNISGLEFGTEYFWMVNAINDCGETASLEVFSFNTVPDLSFDASPTNTTVCQVEGPVFTLSISEGFMAPSTLSFTVTPDQPIEFSYDVDPDNVPSGATVEATAGNLLNVPAGNYVITFIVDDGVNSNEAMVGITVEASPELSTLIAPDNGIITVETSPVLDWSDVANADNYLVEIARDDAFTIIEESNTVSESTYTISQTLESGTYFWRVTSNNDCGAATTQAFSFTVQSNSVAELNGRIINIDPNPTRGNVTVRLSEPLPGDLQIEVFGVNGQRLQQRIYNNNSTNINVDLSTLPAGVYLLRLSNENASLAKRIIVQ